MSDVTSRFPEANRHDLTAYLCVGRTWEGDKFTLLTGSHSLGIPQMQVSTCLSQGATRDADPEDIYAKENYCKDFVHVLWSLVSHIYHPRGGCHEGKTVSSWAQVLKPVHRQNFSFLRESSALL